jgi:hypothetical protein
MSQLSTAAMSTKLGWNGQCCQQQGYASTGKQPTMSPKCACHHSLPDQGTRVPPYTDPHSLCRPCKLLLAVGINTVRTKGQCSTQLHKAAGKHEHTKPLTAEKAGTPMWRALGRPTC